LLLAACARLSIGLLPINQVAQAAAGAPLDSAPLVHTRVVVDAAKAYLEALSPQQRTAALHAFAPQPVGVRVAFGTKGESIAERYGQALWAAAPVNEVPRPGLQLGTLTRAQRAYAMRLLQTILSPKGYQEVLEVMGSNQALHDSGTPLITGRDTYTIGIFGTPSTVTPWMVELGGHHLGLNIVIAGSHAAITPSFIGVKPAVYQDGATMVRALAAANDKAFALMNELTADQRSQAVLNHEVANLLFGPSHDGETIAPEGLKVSQMTLKQTSMVMDLICEWVCMLDDAYARAHLDEIKAGLNDTYFAWSGPLAHEPGMNGHSYFRVQGPSVWIEFSPQTGHGDPEQHIHTIYRDPTNEYGRQFTQP